MKTRILALSAIFAGAGAVSAATLSFQQGVSPDSSYAHLGQDFRGKDNQINNGNVISVGYQASGVMQIRGILGFDLGAIPAGATIDSISLVMTVANGGSGTVGSLGAIELREVIPQGDASNNMVEGQTSWEYWKTDSAWTTPGGDFGNILASASVSGDPGDLFSNGQTATFDTSAAFVAAAQAAFDAGQPLEMILIAPTAEGTTTTTNFVRFGSNDNNGPDAENPVLDYRPLLTITYTIPEPSSSALIGLFALAVCGRRKRS